jgi:hypothetical protein
MRLTALALALFATGLAASGALAEHPPGKKVLICHATHVKKHPYVPVRVSVKSVRALLRHGDVLPTNGKCPSAPGPGTTTSTTTATDPQTTTST